MQDESLESADKPRDVEEFAVGDEMSVWAKALNVILLAVLATASVGYVWLMSSLPRIEGPMPIKGLDMPATVARDHYGVPRITARSVRDAYFVMGWVHSQDRLWQMEMQRRVGAGRLSEVVGDKGLPTDRFMRTLGLYRAAEASFDKLDKPTRDALTAYADGVNAWLTAHWHRLPLEFLALGVRPEPWKPADSLVWARLMALQLTGNWRDELLKAKLAAKIEPRRLKELWPGYPADAPVTLPGRTAAGLLDVLPESAEPRLASNVWVVDGSRTATGKPLLANDPHLEFQAPVLWYLAGIEAPGLSVTGATVPGNPFHLIGHNSRIAWGTTTTHADTVDLFIEKPFGDDGYMTPEGPRKFAVRDEVIRVKGGADQVLKVRTSRNGPVISDLLGKTDEIVAMRATALEPDDLTPQGVLKINRAVDWKTFQGALKDFHAPVQNFAYADTAGTIGFMTAGRVPLRSSGDGSLPVAGHTGQGAWKAWLPFERLPQSLNPKSGRIVNANNRVTPESYPFTISAEWPDGYRAARIGALLDGKPPLALADMGRMQLDDLSLAALELKELVLDVDPAEPLAREAVKLLEAWDGRTDATRPEPLIFAAWMKELWQGIFADELGEDFKNMQRLRPYVLRGALTTARHWCDDTTTPTAESCEQQAAAALDRAVKGLAKKHGAKMAEWKWGEEHRSLFEHAIFKHIPLLGAFADIAVPANGDDFTINRATFGPDGFDAHHGAGLRALYDLSNLDNSRFVIATGQSGNVLSRHFSDQNARWQKNDGLAVGRRPSETAVLTLEPGY